MSNGQQEDKNSLAILWIIAGIFVLGVVIWFSFSEQLKFAFIKLRQFELFLMWLPIQFLPDSIESIREIKLEIYRTYQAASLYTPGRLSTEDALQFSEIVGKYLKVPITISLAWFSFMMYGRNIKMRYRKTYSMDTLAKQESNKWPQINPVIGKDLLKSDVNNGPWAMSLPPMIFCKQYRLIKIAVQLPKEGSLDNEVKFIPILDKGRANNLFSSQLSRLWHGPQSLPPHKRAIFAALVARCCRDSESSNKLLEQINRSCVGGNISNLDFSGSDSIWKKHINKRSVVDIIKMHAYESTVFMALLLKAREDGVLPTADFLWLKPYDRKFWYVLNSVGRQTPVCESAGVHAHFLAECALKRPLGVPMIDEATKALEFALEEIIYVPEPEERDELIRQAEERKL